MTGDARDPATTKSFTDMAEKAAANASPTALARLARTIADTKTAEVESMTDMLTARAAPW